MSSTIAQHESWVADRNGPDLWMDHEWQMEACSRLYTRRHWSDGCRTEEVCTLWHVAFLEQPQLTIGGANIGCRNAAQHLPTDRFEQSHVDSLYTRRFSLNTILNVTNSQCRLSRIVVVIWSNYFFWILKRDVVFLADWSRCRCTSLTPLRTLLRWSIRHTKTAWTSDGAEVTLLLRDVSKEAAVADKGTCLQDDGYGCGTSNHRRRWLQDISLE